ncbi:MAG: ribonuclease III [Clostridia bacterium]|nr:ribonuclease III [Clostridia bacterium]
MIGREYKAEDLNVLSLAYLGDSIQTAYVRARVVSVKGGKVDDLHRICSKLVSATVQARASELLQAYLSESESSVFHRARNCKNKQGAKNADIGDYRKATGLEAVFGYLYLKKEEDRLNELLAKVLELSMAYVEGCEV